jgi:hypothetical protein
MMQSRFVTIFENVAKEILNENIIVKQKAPLFYEMFLNINLEAGNADFRNPKRGNSAFETDICIFEKNGSIETPRIVIEFKKRLTTHDVLTYSSKAGKHKNIYPYLRYGLIASELDHIPGRFFTHNEHIDFMIAAKNYKNKDKLSNLIKVLIEKELGLSKTLQRIQFENEKYDYFQSNILFSKFDDAK